MGAAAQAGGVETRARTGSDDLTGLAAAVGVASRALRMGAAVDADVGGRSRDFVAVWDGAIVGYAGNGVAEAQAGRSWALVEVSPEFRGRGIASALWARVLESAPSSRFLGSVDEADAYSVAVARGKATSEVGVRLMSRLDLMALSDDVVVTALDRMTRADVRFDHPEDLDDPGEWAAIYDAYQAASRSTPDAQAGRQPMPVEKFRSMFSGEDMLLLGRLDSRIVALTSATAVSRDEGKISTLITGVAADLRGCGISTAIKAEHARRLRDAGWRQLDTYNLSHNPAILAANSRLGFEVIGATRELVFDYA